MIGEEFVDKFLRLIEVGVFTPLTFRIWLYILKKQNGSTSGAEIPVSEFCDVLEVSKITVKRHLSALKQAHLIVASRESKGRPYSLAAVGGGIKGGGIKPSPLLLDTILSSNSLASTIASTRLARDSSIDTSRRIVNSYYSLELEEGEGIDTTRIDTTPFVPTKNEHLDNILQSAEWPLVKEAFSLHETWVQIQPVDLTKGGHWSKLKDLVHDDRFNLRAYVWWYMQEKYARLKFSWRYFLMESMVDEFRELGLEEMEKQWEFWLQEMHSDVYWNLPHVQERSLNKRKENWRVTHFWDTWKRLPTAEEEQYFWESGATEMKNNETGEVKPVVFKLPRR